MVPHKRESARARTSQTGPCGARDSSPNAPRSPSPTMCVTPPTAPPDASGTQAGLWTCSFRPSPRRSPCGSSSECSGVVSRSASNAVRGGGRCEVDAGVCQFGKSDWHCVVHLGSTGAPPRSVCPYFTVENPRAVCGPPLPARVERFGSTGLGSALFELRWDPPPRSHSFEGVKGVVVESKAWPRRVCGGPGPLKGACCAPRPSIGSWVGGSLGFGRQPTCADGPRGID